MTTLYKLTSQNYKTRIGYDNETLWGPNVTHTASGDGYLCGPGFLHAYTDPILAVFLNPTHANIQNPVLWECEGDIAKTDNGLKVGCTRLTTIRIIPLHDITTEDRIRFAILCARYVYRSAEFVAWSDAWLSGADRSRYAALEASRAVAWAAAWAASVDAEAAAAAWADVAAAEAARAAAVAAAAAKKINLIAIAHKAIGGG